MQKRLHVFSKAASIGILSVIFRVQRPSWSFSIRHAICSNSFAKDYRKQENQRLLSPSRLSLTHSNAVEDSNYSLPRTKMTSDTALFWNGTAIFEVISSCDDTDVISMISGQTFDDACHILGQFIQTPTTSVDSNDLDEIERSFRRTGDFNKSLSDQAVEDVNGRFANLNFYASVAAERFCQLTQVSDNRDQASRKSKKRTWEALQDAAGRLQNVPLAGTSSLTNILPNTTTFPLESSVLAVCMVFGALSISEQHRFKYEPENSGGAKACASALSSTVSRNNILRQSGRTISSLLLQSYLDHALRQKTTTSYFDLNILNHLAKSFQLTEECVEPRVVAKIVRRTIRLIGTSDQTEEYLKQSVSGAIALACQLRPWSILSPVELIDVATTYDFYPAAEEICKSAHKAAKHAEGLLLQNSFEKNKRHNKDEEKLQYSAARQEENARYAVEKLIDNALECRMYRRADALATSLYHLGGRSRYVEARYFHACDTIAKVITKRQFPIVDRQIERVDKAIAKVGPCNDENDGDDGDSNYTKGKLSPQTSFRSLLRSPSVEIREYAIQKFEEVGEIAAAQRLASIYNIDYVYDEEAALLAATERREKYLQYEDVLPGEVPLLITKPDALLSGFERLLRQDVKNSSSSNDQRQKHIGFDAEWDEETQGAALLQLASVETVLLIDILALSSTEEGVNALRQTVGKLLDNPAWTVIGFACRQDLSRLRASPCLQVQQDGEEGERHLHWMSTTNAVVDVQPLVGNAEASLRKTGLSRACEHFFGKPLDKSEQCSLWSGRPLTERQRSYASLDAWVCVGIYQKLPGNKNEEQET